MLIICFWIFWIVYYINWLIYCSLYRMSVILATSEKNVHFAIHDWLISWHICRLQSTSLKSGWLLLYSTSCFKQNTDRSCMCLFNVHCLYKPASVIFDINFFPLGAEWNVCEVVGKGKKCFFPAILVFAFKLFNNDRSS